MRRGMSRLYARQSRIGHLGTEAERLMSVTSSMNNQFEQWCRLYGIEGIQGICEPVAGFSVCQQGWLASFNFSMLLSYALRIVILLQVFLNRL
jgi:hypothetical protein